MSEPTGVENERQGRPKPPRSMARIAGEILAGTATAAALAFLSLCVVGYGGKIAGWYEGCMGGLAALAIMCLVVPPTYGFGSVFGVFLVGTRGNQTGSLLATLGGGIVGLGLTALLCFYIGAADYMMLEIEKVVLWPLVFLAPPIMATLCFNLTRRYKEPPST